MNEENIIFEGKSSKGIEVIIRYPTLSDSESMCNYINTLSDERTFIRYQGEKETVESERKYLESVLKKIEERKSVVLLCFYENKLIGISGITTGDKTEKHIGIFGLSVAKEYRGNGIGKLLMGKVIEESEKHLPDLEIITICAFSTNTIARSLYKKMGFIEYGILPKGVKLENGYDDHAMMYKVVREPNK